MVQTINETNYKGIIAENDVVVIKCSAEWCAPCKAIKPAYEKLSDDSSVSGVMFCEVSIDENPEIAELFNIRSIPACLIFVKSELKETFVGSDCVTKISQYLQSLC